jgi:hypothetical protein
LQNQNGSIAGSYLHFMTIANNSIKYEQILLYGLRGVVFTRSYYVTLMYKIVKSHI